MDIIILRLINQQLAGGKLNTAKELVAWMGAMQAQDYTQAKWAIGVRLPHLTEQQIESAFNGGEIFRTHLMRPTWHFVSADDIYWMLELTAPQIKSVLNSRHRELGLTEALVNQSHAVIEKALSGNQSMSRESLLQELQKANIPTDLQRASHFMLRAEIDGLICSGVIQGKKQTYALLSERVPVKKTLSKDEALAKLAKSYFTSHGPATLPDFVWWSGLPVTAARKGLEMNKPGLNSFVLGPDTYWFSQQETHVKKLPDSVYLLPAFDEFLISYKNRSAVITAEDHKKAISENGIFRPVVLVNGQISGLWKRTLKKDSMVIETEYFRPHNQSEEQLMARAADSLGHFSEKKAALKFTEMTP
ncbi:MAG TPA: winged helix DNA-binding domain-containing protein [Prolixibacteraceae bacterium]